MKADLRLKDKTFMFENETGLYGFLPKPSPTGTLPVQRLTVNNLTAVPLNPAILVRQFSITARSLTANF